MAYSTPGTRSTDEVITAAIWNQEVRDNVIFNYAPPTCSVLRSAVQVIDHNVTTACAFDAENYDTDSMHSVSTNNSRVTITTTGKYLVTGSLDWESDPDGRRMIAIYKNGAQVKSLNAAPVSGSGECGQSISKGLSLTAGDYIELYAYQNGTPASNLDVTPELEVTWVSG